MFFYYRGMPMKPNRTKFQHYDSEYQTAPGSTVGVARIFPALAFYAQFLTTVFKASYKAKRGQYDDAAWNHSSFEVLRALESVGVRFEISGIDHIKRLERPCVVIANHMSVLETTIIPGAILPFRKVTFIVKNSLLHYPVFKHIMRACNPIAVNRTNPRQDLKTVMEKGLSLLNKGVSIIVFPQTTRSRSFDPKKFNTLGVKLAQRAKVPVVPLALITDAWGNGKHIKEFGKIDPSKKVFFAFGRPLWIEDRGTEAHRTIIHFIEKKLQKWRSQRPQA